MNFLAALAAAILEKIFGKALKAFREWLAERAARKAISDEAKRSVQKLKDAKTGKEVDDAADDTLGGI